MNKESKNHDCWSISWKHKGQDGHSKAEGSFLTNKSIYYSDRPQISFLQCICTKYDVSHTSKRKIWRILLRSLWTHPSISRTIMNPSLAEEDRTHSNIELFLWYESAQSIGQRDWMTRPILLRAVDSSKECQWPSFSLSFDSHRRGSLWMRERRESLYHFH